MSNAVGEVALEGRQLVLSYGGVRALDGISVEFLAGTVTAVIGPNGAGKTSLLNVLAGALHPASGAVMMFGRDVTHHPIHSRARQGLGRTFQGASTFDGLSVVDNLLVADRDGSGGGIAGALFGRRRWKAAETAARTRAMALLDRFGMAGLADRPCGELSGGQRKIVDYLRAVMLRPRLLLLDEPSVGLAPPIVHKLTEDLRRLRDTEICVIIVEHEMDLVRNACDRAIGMGYGRIVADGLLDEVVESKDLQRAYLGR